MIALEEIPRGVLDLLPDHFWRWLITATNRINSKMDIVPGAVTNNISIFNTVGELVDSGVAVAGTGQGSVLQFAATMLHTPDESSTYFIGGQYGFEPQEEGGYVRLYVPAPGIVTLVYVMVYTEDLGSSETSTISVRLNDTDDYEVSDAVTHDAEVSIISNDAMDIAVVAGDYLEIKWETPTWATDPGNIIINGVIFVSGR